MGDSSDTEGVNKESMSKGTVTIEVFVGAVGGAVALAVVVIAIFVVSRRYRLPCRHTSDNTKRTKIHRSNPVFVRQTAPTYDHLTSREQTEYTEIGMTAVGNSGAGSQHNQSTSYERLHTREKAVYTEIGSAFPESKTQYVNQQTDSPAAGSNYEVPENQESSNEPRDYENETNPKKTQASTYEHVYTTPLKHQYTALVQGMSVSDCLNQMFQFSFSVNGGSLKFCRLSLAGW
ncbi:uncharacterized protein LOC128235809 [Mya arenaria]|uniref:uncharacterized protein LOC128235809 n=1 Tax=Mya arenaria TaxID=6604 RepID=UPI0022E8BD52|nr:uncharacterized protein LOC128235809 [Mya arenaria]